MMKGDRTMTIKEVIEVLQELGLVKTKKLKRNYKEEILKHIQYAVDGGEGGIDSLELKELMKCSNTDLYKNINELIKEEKIVKVSVGKKVFFEVK